MAVSKKYAHLPDLDAAPEIYETPELTDDASTVQTGTLRTDSPDPSEEGRHDPDAGLDRQRLDRDEARRKFDPTLVKADRADFSDTIGTTRKDYITGHRRRRKVRPQSELNGFDSGSEDEEETVSQKLARLRRETEELRLELEDQDADTSKRKELQGVDEDVDDLNRILNGLSTYQAPRQDTTLESEFARKLALSKKSQEEPSAVTKDPKPSSSAQPSATTMQAISTFSDRLTALETVLGLPSLSADSPAQTTTILPSLANLSTQLSLLNSTLLPPPRQQGVATITATNQPQQSPQLDALATRMRALTAESEKLTTQRKLAKDALIELAEERIRYPSSHHRPPSRHRIFHQHQRQVSSTTQAGQQQQHQQQHQQQADDEADQIDAQHATLFLEDQASKIAALYQTLPTIQSLSPLLPVVLDRLRSLSVVHAGAAAAHELMESLEQGLVERRGEIAKWAEALGGVEGRMEEVNASMEGNVGVLREMVGRVEERVGRIEGVKGGTR